MESVTELTDDIADDLSLQLDSSESTTMPTKQPFVIGKVLIIIVIFSFAVASISLVIVFVTIFMQLLCVFYSGVAGGTASGKTTVCNMIISRLRDQRVVLVNQVIYYYLLLNYEAIIGK